MIAFLTFVAGLAFAAEVAAPAPVPPLVPRGPLPAPWLGATILAPAGGLALPAAGRVLAFSRTLGFDGRAALPLGPRAIAQVPVVGAERVVGPAEPRVGAADVYRRLLDRFAPRVEGLTPEQRRALWEEAFAHPVAGLDDPATLQRYDPTGIIGFCFGRAMAVHLLARKLGLAESSIAKLFVVGDLRSGKDPEWRFHVATLVRGTDGRWYAIDPILGGPLEVRRWMSQVQATWDRRRQARFYRLPASAVLPDITVVPPTREQESGERLIELSFEPAGRAGFSAASELGPAAYELSASGVERHFKSALSKASPFDFTGIAVNGEPIGYNGYFDDLLASVDSPGRRAGAFPLAKARGGKGGAASPQIAPLGLRIGRLGRPE